MSYITIHIQMPGLVGKITVSITKENNFFIFTIKKNKSFIKLTKNLDSVTGGLYQAKRRKGLLQEYRTSIQICK